MWNKIKSWFKRQKSSSMPLPTEPKKYLEVGPEMPITLIKIGSEWLEIALMVTGRFEGHGYSMVSGNFDGQGISAGVLQWNYGQGSLQEKILKPYVARYGKEALDKYFPSAVVGVSASMRPHDAVYLAKTYMLNGTKVKNEWKLAWENFLLSPGCKDIQIEAAREIGSHAVRITKSWGLKSLRAYCFMFDIVTQNGSIKIAKPKADYEKAKWIIESYASNENRRLFNKIKLDDEKCILLIASYQRAEISNAKWKMDVFSRKSAIAMGEGIVHGEKFYFEELFNRVKNGDLK